MTTAPETVTFSFGRNWQRFLESLTDERIARAEESLTDWLGRLRGKTFLDIGCGSGLFSLAAHRLGAAAVASFDVDSASVNCCERLRERAGSPGSWQVHRGSVLDEAFMRRLGKFDVVYSWGVLHHTGAMWHAIREAARHVAPGGTLHLALYNRASGWKTWLRLKRLYNRLPGAGKRLMEWTYAGAWGAWSLVRLRSPWRRIREYRSHRGMSWRTDVVDWLGGLPYEVATVAEVKEFVAKEAPQLRPVRVLEVTTTACNWFLFRS
jgi:2-polyprenyl-6-hydroxyphenyl methylase/3-demethylubiquinone-9 3-methyltransferase